MSLLFIKKTDAYALTELGSTREVERETEVAQIERQRKATGSRSLAGHSGYGSSTGPVPVKLETG